MFEIIEKSGSIFDSDCSYLVNPVNCAGVWGAGLAKQFKERYPSVFDSWIKEYGRGLLRPGYCPNWYSLETPRKIIFCFPTKDHWKDPSKLCYIRWGIHHIFEYIIDSNSLLENDYIYHLDPKIYSIAMPRLGCGLGGLNWKDVKKEIEKFQNLPHPEIKIYVYDGK